MTANILKTNTDRQRNLFLTLVVWLKDLLIGGIFCLTPVTAIIVLGWLVRDMRRTVLKRLSIISQHPDGVTELDRSHPPSWFLDLRGNGFFRRTLGGLFENAKTGLATLPALFLATLPFTAAWAASWWAGWENSFNKGYEQSWVGPTLGLLGTAIGLWIMAHLPLAIVHMAVERHATAIFEIRRIRGLVAAAGIRYILLSAFFVFFALPLFAIRGLPVFGENIVPGLADMTAKEVEGLVALIAFAKAVYIFFALRMFRRLSARVYAYAVLRSSSAEEIYVTGGGHPKRFGTMFRSMQLVLLAVIWFGLVAQIFVGQFLNQNWWIWFNHPWVVLPWMP